MFTGMAWTSRALAQSPAPVIGKDSRSQLPSRSIHGARSWVGQEVNSGWLICWMFGSIPGPMRPVTSLGSSLKRVDIQKARPVLLATAAL